MGAIHPTQQAAENYCLLIKAKILISREDISIVKKQVKDTYAKIMKHEFTLGCGEEDCKWCNFVKENTLN